MFELRFELNMDNGGYPHYDIFNNRCERITSHVLRIT